MGRKSRIEVLHMYYLILPVTNIPAPPSKLPSCTPAPIENDGPTHRLINKQTDRKVIREVTLPISDNVDVHNHIL